MKEIFGPFTFETTTRELRRDGEIVKLQSQPAQVLAVMIEHAGAIVTRDALRAAIWGDDTFVTARSVDTLVKRIRKKVEPDPEEPRFILTVWGTGYKFADA